MKVSYRIVEEITPNGEWETVGVIIHWPDASPPMQLRGLLQHTVSRSIWRKIRQEVSEKQLNLETYHEALEKYNDCYQILPEIHQLQAQNEAEIRKLLREKYVFVNEKLAITKSGTD